MLEPPETVHAQPPDFLERLVLTLLAEMKYAPPDRLEHLMDVALVCATIDEFRAALSEPPHLLAERG